jgi:hypothetical protein
MNRNAQILALTGCVAAILAVAWWTMPGVSRDGAPASTPQPDSTPTMTEEDPVLGRLEAPSTTSSAEGPERIPAQIERRVEGVKGPISYHHEPAKLVSGVVRDESGKTVEDALVLVIENGTADRPGEPFAILASGRSEPDGRFEIRTIVRPKDLQARASKAGYANSDPAVFERGASNLALVLRQGRIVSGRLLVNRWIDPRQLTVEISAGSNPTRSAERTFARSRPLGGSPDGDRTYLFEVDEQGRFTVPGFSSPTVELRVSAMEDPWPAVEISDVAVRRPGEAPDSRLDPLDLRGKFERLAVDVLDDHGREVDRASVTLRDPELPSGSRSRSTMFGGRAEFLTRAGPHDIEIESDGFRRVRLESAIGDQVVRLRRGIPVLVRVRGKSARPPPPDLLAVGFLRTEDTRQDLDRVGTIDGIGTLKDPLQTTFLVASPGIHQVAWYLQTGNTQAYLRAGTVVRVDVHDQESVQEIVLDLPDQAEAAWTSRLKDIERELEDRKKYGDSRVPGYRR